MRHAAKFGSKTRTPGPSLFRRFLTRLALEELESRTLLSVYTPLQISQAYGVNQVAFNNGAVKGDGAGQTIAIVDAYYDPTIQADLAAFSKRFNLPQLDGTNGNGTFQQIDLSNGTLSPRYNDWTLETALDVEWAHAIAPKANIVLVEAASDNQEPATGKPTDLLNAVQFAATQTGAQVVSMSWGIPEVPGETSWDSYFTPGVTFVAASGDQGAGTVWPAVSPYVVSVGGTTLQLTSSNGIARETGWGNGSLSKYYGGSGGGFSQYEALPSFQQNSGISSTFTQFNARLSPDVAYDANPSTGYYVVDGAAGGWYAVGGTSAGAPQWAALVAIADQGRAEAGLAPLSSSDTLSALYSNPQDFHSITQGTTGTYYVVDNSGRIISRIPVKAAAGYNLVTGLGSPAANLLIPDLAPGSTALVSQSAVQTTSSSGNLSNLVNTTTSTSTNQPSKTATAPNAPAATNVPTAPAPTNSPSTGTTGNQPTAPTSPVLVGLFGVPTQTGLLAPATSVFTPATAFGTTITPAPVLLAPTGLGVARSAGGSGVSFADIDNQPMPDKQPADNQPMAPANPDAPVPEAPMGELNDAAPLVSDGMEVGFIADEGSTGTTEDESGASVELGSASRVGSAAVLAVAFALVWGQRDATGEDEDRERQRPHI
jgi:subtilase family serine protease